jgi:hypothetical protein
MPRRRSLLLLPLLILSACNPGQSPPEDTNRLQTDAGEAALRYIIGQCPKRAEAQLAVITVGEKQARAMPAFVERFKNVEGLTFIDYSRLKPMRVDGVVRVADEHTSKPALELQISSLTDAKDGVQEAIAAWAWQDEAARSRLEVKAKPGGGYEVRELEKIPLPQRSAAQ